MNLFYYVEYDVDKAHLGSYSLLLCHSFKTNCGYKLSSDAKLKGVVIEAFRGIVPDISRIVLSSLENFCFERFICKCTNALH